MKSLIFITNLASFYKVNLYNELIKVANVNVCFLDKHSNIRNADFYSENMNFKYEFIPNSNIFIRVLNAIILAFRLKGDTIILGGWERIEYYIIALLSPKRKNALVVESSCLESKTTGIKGFIKRLYLSRISKVYVPGESNKKLLEDLNFKRDIIITHGVGLANYVDQAPYVAKDVVSRFIYVGRLSAEKNIEYIIRYFNNNPHLSLTIVGFGPLDEDLKKVANCNIQFTGAITNRDLSFVYRNHDIFILPSISEPWGLVVEEALNNGLPVLLSEKVGCAADLVVSGKTGFTFKVDDDFATLDLVVKKSIHIDTYNEMLSYISKSDIAHRIQRQIDSYLQWQEQESTLSDWDNQTIDAHIITLKDPQWFYLRMKQWETLFNELSRYW